MWLSSTAQTALRAVVHLAARGDDGPVPADEIAAELDFPRNYLSKTLHALARAGVLRSTRGPHGGFELVDPPDRLALERVVEPFAPALERRCLLGRPNCGEDQSCPAHQHWSDVAAGVEEFFRHTTVADLLSSDHNTPAIPAGTLK